ncbi:MAG: HD domain-containing protein [Aureliella sp.]
MSLIVPELGGHVSRIIRIPSQVNVSVTPRVMRLVDSPQMQRLRQLSQLGLVSRVYPGASHSRFEHSLGVFHLAQQVALHLLSSDERFADEVTAKDIELFLAAALLHDIGHWPYCHPIEDMGLDWVPRHESMAVENLSANAISQLLSSDWSLSPEEIVSFLSKPDPAARPTARGVLQNVLNGPVDVDKMDYLQRDSLHAGVPYGSNFDQPRLIASLCVNWADGSLALRSKGKTAAEMLVFSRYVMFSEVYWHHAVRSGTAMLQRLVFETQAELRERGAPNTWKDETDATFHDGIVGIAARSESLQTLAAGLFGTKRRFFKRIGQFTFAEAPEIHTTLRGRSYSQLVSASQHLAELLSSALGKVIRPTDVLIDAPPQKLEVQFRVAVKRAQTADFIALSEVSPVVNSLATSQFDNFVKQVRVFVNPDLVHPSDVSNQRVAEMLVQL